MRKLFAIAAAMMLAALVAAPANAADPGDLYELVVGNYTSGDHDVSAENSGTVTVGLGDQTLNCDGVEAEGVAHAGSPVADPYLEFTDTNFVNCDAPFGLKVKITQNCPLTVSAVPNPNQTVNTALTDTAVTGELSAGTLANPCLTAKDTLTNGFLCTLSIAGSTDADYNEVNQTLVVSGDDLFVVNSSCPGASNNDAVTLGLTFAVDSVDGDLNFRPDPNA